MAIDIEAWYLKYGPMVLRRCRALLRNEEKALDAMQDVFVNLLKRQDRLEGTYPSSLLFRVATNVCLNRIRDEKRAAHPVPDEQLAEIACAENVEQRLLAGRWLDWLFQKERPSTREMLVMLHVDGMTLEETAAATGLSVSGVRKRVREFKARAGRIKGEKP